VVETEKGPIEQTTTTIGLNIAHKVITIYADNTPNNDTFCDYFLRKLQEDGYDEDPQSNLGLSHYLF